MAYSEFEKYAIVGLIGGAPTGLSGMQPDKTAFLIHRLAGLSAALPSNKRKYFKYAKQADYEKSASPLEKTLSSLNEWEGDFTDDYDFQDVAEANRNNPDVADYAHDTDRYYISDFLDYLANNITKILPDYDTQRKNIEKAINDHVPRFMAGRTAFKSSGKNLGIVIDALSNDQTAKDDALSKKILFDNTLSLAESETLIYYYKVARYWNIDEKKFMDFDGSVLNAPLRQIIGTIGTNLRFFSLDAKKNNTYNPKPPFKADLTGSGKLDITVQDEAKQKELLNRILDLKLEGIKADSYHQYSVPSLAKIILARRAIIVLMAGIKQALGQADETEGASLQAPESFIEAAAAAISADPDFEKLEEGLDAASQKAVRTAELAPQCYLIKNIIEAAKLNRKKLNVEKIKNQRVRLVSNPKNTAATINKLTKRDSQKNMLKMRPDHISKLYPYLRIWKVLYNQDGKTEANVRFKFPHATNIEDTNETLDIFEKINNVYTQEYGVKSFSWNLIGSDPFSYSNDIDATLIVYFNDFEQLTIERKQSKYKYRLLDLIAPREDEEGFAYDIRVDVGWSGPTNPEEIMGFNTRHSIRTLFLAMTDYDIAFNAEGYFELTINYKARLEQALYDRKMNILLADEDSEKDLKRLKERLAEARKSENTELIRNAEFNLTQRQFNTKGNLFNGIVNTLVNEGRIFSEEASPGQLFGDDTATAASFQDNVGQISSNPNPFKNLKNIITLSVTDPELFSSRFFEWFTFNRSKARRKKIQGIKENDAIFIPEKKNNMNYVVSFFFLGDLIEVLSRQVMDPSKFSASEKQYVKDIRILTTDFMIYDPLYLSTKKVEKINISDIPISTDLFMKFYFEKVIKYTVSNYSLMKFIRDLISYCILNIFEECFGEDNLKTTLNTGFIDFEKKNKKDPFEVYAEETNKVGEEIEFNGIEVYLQGSGNKFKKDRALRSCYVNLNKDKSASMPEPASLNERSECIHALVISSESSSPAELKIRNYKDTRDEDNNNGLYHLDIGSHRGILKKINFSKTDQKYLREQRFTQKQSRGFSILSNVFDVDVDLVGNTMFFPGQRVFINLGERFSALEEPYDKNSISGIMGLGGYHIVTAVENEISTDGFTTKLKCRYENSGNGKNSDPSQGLVTATVSGASSGAANK